MSSEYPPEVMAELQEALAAMEGGEGRRISASRLMVLIAEGFDLRCDWLVDNDAEKARFVETIFPLIASCKSELDSFKLYQQLKELLHQHRDEDARPNGKGGKHEP